MRRAPLPDAKLVSAATGRLLSTVRSLGDEQVAGPTLLPGWTRGHVLTHLSRHADALGNLLRSARTGEPLGMYASVEHRNAAIEAGAGRGAAEQVADLTASAERLAATIESLPDEAWSATVAYRQGPGPAARIPFNRLCEVELHHLDLDLGYSPESWDPAFAGRLLTELAADFAARPDVPALRLVATDSGGTYGTDGVSVSGTAASLAAWLTGRPAPGLSADAPLPALPAWK